MWKYDNGGDFMDPNMMLSIQSSKSTYSINIRNYSYYVTRKMRLIQFYSLASRYSSPWLTCCWCDILGDVNICDVICFVIGHASSSYWIYKHILSSLSLCFIQRYMTFNSIISKYMITYLFQVFIVSLRGITKYCQA